MALPDVFNSDLFSLRGLTGALKLEKYAPSKIQSMNLFDYRGVNTTNVFIDIMNDSLGLVPTSARGSTPQSVVGDKYESRPFKTVHLAQRSNVMADEVQGIRAFDTEDGTMGVQMKISEHLAKHKRQLMLTKENHQFGAIKGLILDADGSTILDLHDAMGTTQTEFNFVLDVTTTKVQGKCVELERLIEDTLEGTAFTGITVLCGRGFMDQLVAHPSVEESYRRYREGAFLRDNYRAGFVYGGILWEEYRAGAGITIRTNEAWAIPTGVPEMLVGRYAPADYVDTVNQVGIEMYSKARPLPFDKGVEIETQAEWLHINTRPNAIIRLAADATELGAV